MIEGEEGDLPMRLTNVELEMIVKEKLVDKKKIKASLEQEKKEKDEKDKEIRIMMETILALERRDKSIRQDEEVINEEEEEELKEEE